MSPIRSDFEFQGSQARMAITVDIVSVIVLIWEVSKLQVMFHELQDMFLLIDYVS
jgi:hypothetical protein